MRNLNRVIRTFSPRVWALINLTFVVPLGFVLKYYSGPGQWWLNNWGSSFCYEIFFMLLIFLLIPRKDSLTKIAILVCVGTCLLEFLQLWKTPWLHAIRSNFLGGILLGNEFSWLDLPAYPIGCLLGWLLLRSIMEFSQTK